jgi:hypothetical protein
MDGHSLWLSTFDLMPQLRALIRLYWLPGFVCESAKFPHSKSTLATSQTVTKELHSYLKMQLCLTPMIPCSSGVWWCLKQSGNRDNWPSTSHQLSESRDLHKGQIICTKCPF